MHILKLSAVLKNRVLFNTVHKMNFRENANFTMDCSDFKLSLVLYQIKRLLKNCYCDYFVQETEIGIAVNIERFMVPRTLFCCVVELIVAVYISLVTPLRFLKVSGGGRVFCLLYHDIW